MNLDKAAMIEGMVVLSRAMLQEVADRVRDNVPEDYRREMALKIGAAMAELNDVSWMLHARYPILDPYPEETRIAAEMRAKAASEKKGD